jgi:hypothetical protein
MKLSVEVVYCSSEEPSRPSSNLNSATGEDNSGYQSGKNQSFPIILTFKINDGPSHVNMIHLISHEFKIPTVVEIYVGIPKKDFKPLQIEYFALGFFFFFFFFF